MTFPILPSNSQTGYFLQRSLRFRKSAGANLSRTLAASGNTKTWTVRFLLKCGELGTSQYLYGSLPNGSNDEYIYFDANNKLNYEFYNAGVLQAQFITSKVYRDPSAFYDIQIAKDNNQATAANRIKVYDNGVQITAFDTVTYPSTSMTGYINDNTAPQKIGTLGATGSGYFDGYLCEFYFIDGQQLTPSSFGSTNSTTGVWQPAAYTGTYGTNGFYLPFTDNSALTTSSNVGLGKDFSGNGNYWTTNNISITAGVTYDSMTDVPTLTSATASNFAVLNPLNAELGMTGTLSDANLTLSGSGGKRSTIAARSGKWYWEFVSNSGASSNFPMSGLYVAGLGTYYPGLDANSVGYFQGGDIYYNGSSVFTASSFTNGDIIGFAWDADTGKFWVAKNGTWQNSGNPAAGTGQVATISTGVDRVVGAYSSSGSSAINFGQRPFTYTPPSGFVALNTYNLPNSTILKGNKVMDATLYTGNLAGQVITNAATFQPDLVWVKSRSAATDNKLTDSVRGATKALISNSSAAETTDITGVVSFNSNGFTLGTSTTYNNLAATYVAWQWKANGAAVSNTSGTITSTVSVNASAGFSVVTYTGTGANATVGHGLGVVPKMIIVKRRSAAGDWCVWNLSAAAQFGSDRVLFLNTTDAATAAATNFNSSSPTSSVLNIGTNPATNASGGTYVAYCWSEIDGFSKFGSYTGNASVDGPFVYCGFQPKFVMVKRTDSTGDWFILDEARDEYNVATKYLSPNLFAAEATTPFIDFLSNGFKLRTASTSANGTSMIFAAFASNPFKNSLAR